MRQRSERSTSCVETRTHRVELRVDVGGLVSPQDQNPGRHVARVLAGHQDGELPERRHRLSGVSVTRAAGGDGEELGPAYLMMTPLCMKMLMKCEPVQPLDSQ